MLYAPFERHRLPEFELSQAGVVHPQDIRPVRLSVARSRGRPQKFWQGQCQGTVLANARDANTPDIHSAAVADLSKR